MDNKNLKRLVVVILMLQCQAFTVAQEANKSGLKRFIVGGGKISKSTRSAFVKMAGGKDARLVVVPTATSDANLPSVEEEAEFWGQFGVQNVEVIHTRDPKQANETEFLKPLESATGVWIGGGDQRRLSDAYVGTKFETMLGQLSKKGIVIGGTSAGAAIQSKVMIQGGRDDPELGTGFNLLPNAIVDQHFLERSRLNRLCRAVEAFPSRTGIGISEGTALAVDGDSADVIGSGFVIAIRMVDNRLNFRSFRRGDRIEMKNLNLVP